MSIKLRQATVADARNCYLNNIPLKCCFFQSYRGLDINGEIPTINGMKDLDTTIQFDGSLKFKHSRTKHDGVINDWLRSDGNGPYKPDSKGDYYYYLGCKAHPYEFEQVQICSRPLNVLSTSCIDEVNIWIPL